MFKHPRTGSQQGLAPAQSEFLVHLGLYSQKPVVGLQEAAFPAGQLQILGVLVHFPVAKSHESTVHGLPSSQFLGLNEQAPAVEQEATVQRSAETHLGANTHPIPAWNLSLVQALLSLQTGWMVSHCPVALLHL